MHTHTHAHARTHTHMHTRTHTHTNTYMHACTHTYLQSSRRWDRCVPHRRQLYRPKQEQLCSLVSAVEGHITGEHTNITLSFLVVGHTKFAPDWCFGLFKRLFKRTRVGSLNALVEVVQRSGRCNEAQLVVNVEGSVIVPTYDWISFFAPRFRKDTISDSLPRTQEWCTRRRGQMTPQRQDTPCWRREPHSQMPLSSQMSSYQQACRHSGSGTCTRRYGNSALCPTGTSLALSQVCPNQPAARVALNLQPPMLIHRPSLHLKSSLLQPSDHVNSEPAKSVVNLDTIARRARGVLERIHPNQFF